MDMLILSVTIIVAVMLISGKSLKIEITHKQVLPESKEEEIKPDKEDEDIENAYNIMKNFNKEWSGLEDGE